LNEPLEFFDDFAFEPGKKIHCKGNQNRQNGDKYQIIQKPQMKGVTRYKCKRRREYIYHLGKGLVASIKDKLSVSESKKHQRPE